MISKELECQCKKCRWEYINSDELPNCTSSASGFNQLDYEDELKIMDQNKCTQFIAKQEFEDEAFLSAISDDDTETMEF